MNTMLMAHVPYKHLFSLLIMFNLPVSLPTTSVVCFSFIWQIAWSLLDFLVLITMCLVYSSQHSLLASLISVFEDHSVSMLAQVIAVASSTLQATKWESPSLLASSPPPSCKSMTMVHDTVLFTSLCFCWKRILVTFKSLAQIKATLLKLDARSMTALVWWSNQSTCSSIFQSLSPLELLRTLIWWWLHRKLLNKFCTWYYQYDVVCIF